MTTMQTQALLHAGDNLNYEESLESQHIVELQAFIERRVWIEEKIQFLESLPTIEVFAGADIVGEYEDSSSVVSSAQLAEWLVEHDRIERETEIFDSGDLQKLKKFTKAATQRNLSREDTDLIELTLTTIYALDKLLHLLRDRSEKLDLLSLRLTWESHRRNCWIERRLILDGLRKVLHDSTQRFLSLCRTRKPLEEPALDLLRLGRNVSAGESSVFPNNNGPKELQIIASEASELNNRILLLKKGDLTGSAVTLDKLVNDSRLRIPEDFLDEQDRLDDECGTQLEQLGEFIVNVTLQRGRAYDIHKKILRDETCAIELLKDVRNALLCNPDYQQNEAFKSRIQELRMALLSNNSDEILNVHSPECVRLIFPEQSGFDSDVYRALSDENAAALRLSREAEELIQQYSSKCTVFKNAGDISQVLYGLETQLYEVTRRLTNGSFGEENFDDVKCLESESISAFLGEFTPFANNERGLCIKVDKGLETARNIVVELDNVGLVATRDILLHSVQHLSSMLARENKLFADVTDRANDLRQVSTILSIMRDHEYRLAAIMNDIREKIIQTQWHNQWVSEIYTAEREISVLCLASVKQTSNDTILLLDDIEASHKSRVLDRLAQIEKLSPKILDPLVLRNREVSNFLREVRSMNDLLLKLIEQSCAFETAIQNAHILEGRLNRIDAQIDAAYQDILTKDLEEDTISYLQDRLVSSAKILRSDVESFQNALHSRITFITTTDAVRFIHEYERTHTNVEFDENQRGLHLSFNLEAADEAVRLSCNSYSTRLSVQLESKENKLDLLELASKVRHFDGCISIFKSMIEGLFQQLGENFSRLQSLEEGLSAGTSGERLEADLASLKSDTRELHSHSSYREQVKLSLASTRKAMAALHNHSVYSLPNRFLEPRTLAMNDVESSAAEFFSMLDRYHTSLESAVNHAASFDISECAGNSIPKETARDWSNYEAANVLDEATSVAKEKQEAFDVFNENPCTVQCSTAIIDMDKVNLLRTLIHQSIADQFLDGLHSPQLIGPEADDRTRSAIEDVTGAAGELRFILLSVDDHESKTYVEVSSLLAEADALLIKLFRMEQLDKFSRSIRACDSDLSDLLNLIDSYTTNVTTTAPLDGYFNDDKDKHMLERLSNSENYVKSMAEQFRVVCDDRRVVVEHDRILQTWSELREMALDRLNGISSRPVSAQSSSKLSHGTPSTNLSYHGTQKLKNYGRLSTEAPRYHDGLLSPPLSKRSVSSGNNIDSWPIKNRLPLIKTKSRSNRSVSGPSTSSLYNSTFSSRQRTASMSSTPFAPISPIHARPIRTHSKRAESPAYSEISVKSNTENTSRSVSNVASFRSSRLSLGSVRREALPQQKGSTSRRKYIADPDNKLDVAVGNVVNRLPVDISVQVVADTWKDQSGKYWIGDAEPRLCFCRILRSQSVMVRVGGGWTELSKFIQNHFADEFQSMPKPSAILNPMKQGSHVFNERPKTPESGLPDIPSFILSTPIKGSPHSLKSMSSAGSPLTPLQFMRRADSEAPDLSSISLSKGSASRSKGHIISTPRSPIWRP